MTTTTLSPSEPHFLTDKQGNTIYAVLPIDQYHQMLDIVRSYEMGDDLLTEEDIKEITISREQLKRGLGIKNEDVFKEIEEKRKKGWK